MNVIFATLVALIGLTTASAITYDATCSCFAQIGSTGRLSAAQLLGDVLNDAPKPETCDEQGFQDCHDFCAEKTRIATNDFTLNLPPTSRANVDTTLGQYICNLIGRDVSNQQVNLLAKLDCSHASEGMHFSKSRLAGTGHSAKEALTCEGGQYVKPDGEAVDHGL